MTLGEKQRIFTRLVGLLIEEAYARGYELTLGEAYRTPEQAKLNAEKGSGIANSLHCDRLAIDLNLFRDGKYLTDTESWRPLGEWWKQLSTPQIKCCWGGAWTKRADGNHFSIEHEGVE